MTCAHRSELLGARELPFAAIRLQRDIFRSASEKGLRAPTDMLRLRLSGPTAGGHVSYANDDSSGTVGSLAYFPGGVPFDAMWEAGIETSLFVHFHCAGQGRPPAGSSIRSALSLSSPCLREAMVRITQQMELENPSSDAMIEALTLHIARLLHYEIRQEPACQGPAIEDVVLHIQTMANIPKLRQIAAEFGYSEGYLGRSFQQITGHSFSSHVANVKARRAERLLERADLPLKEISYRLGYRTPDEFSRSFKRITGLTPSAFKARARP